jgi:DNA-binding NarL/FixJ family response regulator
VSHIIVKSWDPEQIIQVVAEALSSAQDSVMPLPREEFHREHLRLLNAKLLQKVEELRDAVILAGTLQVQSDRGGEIASGLGSAYGARPQDLLSKRELEVLAMIAEGAPNARIAERLSIAQSTVHSHVKRITRKLGVSNRTEAAARYLRR